MPGPRGARGDLRRARDSKGVVLRLFGYLKPHVGALLLVVLMTLAASLFAVLQPTITGGITTALYEGVSGGVFDWDKIRSLLIMLVGIYVASQAFQAIQGIV